MRPDYINQALRQPREISQISGVPLEIVTLQEAKDFLRVTTSANDQLITDLIAQAGAEAVSITGQYWGTGQFLLKGYGSYHQMNSPEPLQTIDSVEIEGNAAQYKYHLGGLVEITDPVEEGQIVEITYTVGHTTADPDVQSAVLQRVKFAYDYGDDLPYDAARFFDRLMNRHRVNWTG